MAQALFRLLPEILLSRDVTAHTREEDKTGLQWGSENTLNESASQGGIAKTEGCQGRGTHRPTQPTSFEKENKISCLFEHLGTKSFLWLVVSSVCVFTLVKAPLPVTTSSGPGDYDETHTTHTGTFGFITH
ncbi:unnamed protein product [Arctogadus glacialis]